METDPVKQRSRQKRRERALQLQHEKQTREEEEASGQDDQESPPRSSKDKLPRSKPKKGKSALFEEDIIDGFAILSFKTLEELEIISNKNGCIKNKCRPEEDTSTKDTNYQDKDDGDKVKKKKIKKNASLIHCINNCADNNENVNDSIPSIALSNINSGTNCSNSTNIISEISGTSTSIGGNRVSNVNNDSNNDNHHRHPRHNHSKNGPLEPPRSVSRDGLSDASTRSGSGQGYVCDVESGDDKASESGSDLYSGVPAVGKLNDPASKSHISPCVSLCAPTPPPSTSVTPTPLCNGTVGSTNQPATPVPHVLVATTTTTTTTTTSRSGFGDSLTTSTAVAAASLSSQSVIHPTPYFSDHQGLKPAQFSPSSFLSQSHNIRTLSPNSQHHQNSHVNSADIDTPSCARSLQYSKSHKSYPSHSTSQGTSPCQSPVNVDRINSPHRHQNQPPGPVSDNLPQQYLNNVPNSLNHQAPNHLQSSHFPFHGHSPGSGYPSAYPSYPPHIHPDPSHIRPDQLRIRPDQLVNHHSSPHAGSDSGVDQQCNRGSSQSLISKSITHVPTAAITSTLISSPRNLHHPQQHHHHGSSSINSSHHRPSSSQSSRKSSTYSHHNSHHHSNPSRPQSPSGHRSKRPCRTPPSGLPPPTPSPLSVSSVLPPNDTSKNFTTPFPPKPQNNKPEHIGYSSIGSGKDHTDARSKEGSVSHVHHPSNNHPHQHNSKYHRDKDKDRERDREREERDKRKTPVSLGISLAHSLFPSPKPVWASSPGPLYSHLLQLHQPSPLTPSSALHSLCPHPSSSSAPSHTSSLFTLPLAPPPPLLAAGTPTLSAGMFATPLHPAPPSLSSTAPLPTHPGTSSQYSPESLIRSQDFLHQDLNNRLLAHRDSSAIALSHSPFVRNETHQHQHQHLHNHMHQHTYGGLSPASLVPPSSPSLFDKIPKAFDAGVFRPSIVPNYSAAFSSLLPPGPSGASLSSSLQGAFQPKNLVAPGQMLVPFRDREKAVPPPGLPPPQKKQGKWCAAHVRVAWEVYHRQQKKLQRDQDGATGPSSSSSSKSGTDNKPLEPLLRPPSSLLSSGSSTVRQQQTEASLLASVARSLPDGVSHPSSSSFLQSTAHLGMSPYPRPSPYPLPSLLNTLGFSGLGGGMFSSVRDMAPPGLPSSLSSPHEWNRLHRTPSSFPSWPKSEAEKERERELRKEEERERDRRLSLTHQLAGLEDVRHKDESSRPKSRSRSRSPVRNGRVDHHSKSEMGAYERRYEDKRPLSSSAASSAMKMKEERRDDDMPSLSHHLVEREKFERERMERERLEKDRFERDRMERERMEKEKLLQNAAVAEREKLLQAVEQREKFLQTSGYLGLSPFVGSGFHTHPGLLDRRVGLMGPPGAGYPFLERPPVPTSMWNPFDKSSAEIGHRLEVDRERERMVMMSRLSSIPSHLAALEQERLREQILRDQQEREYELRRQYLDRLPAFTADRLRAVDPLALGSYFPRTVSPMFGPGGLAGLKSNSPHGMPGAPPPLIPSSSSSVANTMLSSRSHNNSPSSSSKSKGCSPADSTSDLKDKREGSSTDPDAHSR